MAVSLVQLIKAMKEQFLARQDFTILWIGQLKNDARVSYLYE